jgi:hypothetical protein
MVTAGRKIPRMIGSVVKKERISASRKVKNGVINRPTLNTWKTIMKM